ncbi:MAG: response regulator transcription factor [Myxococcales bacterium]|nr:response regulator transcription factor [Myxococcales bacterium]
MRILVVEDAAKLAAFISRVLREEGYTVDQVGEGELALEQIAKTRYELVILDWMLPGIDGLAVCRQLRSQGITVPIMMLTARGETGERVIGLDAGADDFLAKPFEVEELLARVRALMRRSTGYGTLRCGDLEIDRVNLRVTINGEPVHLTQREYALLLHLAHQAGRTVRRTELLEQVFDLRIEPGSNVVEVHISRLREKLGEHASIIETVRGVGYRLRGSV